MANPPIENPLQYVGAKIDPETGKIDLSQALRYPNEEQPDEAEIPSVPEEEVTRIVKRIKTFQPLLTMRNAMIRTEARLLGVPSKHLDRLVKESGKEEMKRQENGNLFHYHQTSLEAFASAAEMGALMSYNILKELGKAPGSSGSRPDVVQMTRDRYDAAGKLLSRGLVPTLSLGSAGSGVALVFKPEIVDVVGYDCLDAYPNIAAIPLTQLEAVLVEDEETKVRVNEIMTARGIQARLLTREEWAQELDNMLKR